MARDASHLPYCHRLDDETLICEAITLVGTWPPLSISTLQMKFRLSFYRAQWLQTQLYQRRH